MVSEVLAPTDKSVVDRIYENPVVDKVLYGVASAIVFVGDAYEAITNVPAYVKEVRISRAWKGQEQERRLHEYQQELEQYSLSDLCSMVQALPRYSPESIDAISASRMGLMELIKKSEFPSASLKNAVKAIDALQSKLGADGENGHVGLSGGDNLDKCFDQLNQGLTGFRKECAQWTKMLERLSSAEKLIDELSEIANKTPLERMKQSGVSILQAFGVMSGDTYLETAKQTKEKFDQLGELFRVIAGSYDLPIPDDANIEYVLGDLTNDILLRDFMPESESETFDRLKNTLSNFRETYFSLFKTRGLIPDLPDQLPKLKLKGKELGAKQSELNRSIENAKQKQQYCKHNAERLDDLDKMLGSISKQEKLNDKHKLTKEHKQLLLNSCSKVLSMWDMFFLRRELKSWEQDCDNMKIKKQLSVSQQQFIENRGKISEQGVLSSYSLLSNYRDSLGVNARLGWMSLTQKEPLQQLMKPQLKKKLSKVMAELKKEVKRCNDDIRKASDDSDELTRELGGVSDELKTVLRLRKEIIEIGQEKENNNKDYFARIKFLLSDCDLALWSEE